MLLQITSSNVDYSIYGGGSLIAPNFVLTAASILRNATYIRVDIGSIEFLKPFETQYTTQYLSHPDYNDEFKTNNIAVIRLHESVAFRTNVRAILLPRLSEITESYEFFESYASGFGVSEAGSNYLSEYLRFAHQTVISNNECHQSFSAQYITESVMCAVGYNGSNQSLCYGDQGGALVSHVDGAFVQIGVSSIIHSNGCYGNAPAGFTRVAPYLQWISSLTGIVLRP